MLRAMFRTLAIAALFALAAPTLAAAEEPHPGPGHPPPARAVPHPGPPPGARPAVVPHGPPPGGVHPALRPAFVPHPGGPPGPVGGPHGPIVGVHGPVIGPGRFSFRGHDFERVHIRPFIYPPGWAYRQWAVGAILPPLFLAPDYYYPEWAALGLDPPPPGFQWVRYGPDLLLVNVETGQVADVAYGVFYD